MLPGGTVTAPDVATLRAAAEMKPPALRRLQAFRTTVATWFRSPIDRAVIFLHFECSVERCASEKSSIHRRPASSFAQCTKFSTGQTAAIADSTFHRAEH